jgi:integrase
MGTKKAERTEKTAYPGIYKRLYGGKLVGYQCKPRRLGLDVPSKTFDRLTDARAWLEKQHAAGRRAAVGSSKATLNDAIARYSEEELPKLARSDRPNRERQLAWWRDRLGSRLLREVGRAEVRDALHSLRQGGSGLRRADEGQGRPAKLATANRYRAALSAVLSVAAEEWEWLPLNPLHKGSRRRKAKAEREVERDRVLLPEERERLWRECRRSRDPRLYTLVVCLYASGARTGELMALEWSRFQLYPKVRINAGKYREGSAQATVVDPKNGDDRVIYFPGEAGELLRAFAEMPRLSRYVFAADDEPADALPTFPRMAFRRARERAGLEDVRPHDLRHCWACNLLDSGATLPQLMVLGGWRSVAMVRRYASRAQRHGSDAVEALARQLEA